MKTKRIDEQKKLLTIQDVQAIYGIPAYTLYAAIKSKMPHLRFNRRIYFDREVLENWFQRNSKNLDNEMR